LSRSNIQDSEGNELAKILYNNRTLRKLELEGNQLGPDTASAFGKALKINTTLKSLDLENNSLCGEEKFEGMIEFIKALETNNSLISLNIGKNKLEEPIGE